MFGIVFVRSIGVLCGIGAVLLTVFFVWAVIGGARNTHADYGAQHYAGPLSTARGWDGQR